MKARRTAAGFTQEQAGAWIGVTKQGFAKLEAGSSPLDVRRARVIAERLACRMEDLL
jgi:DNA-binding XRE family transcriptional regulator